MAADRGATHPRRQALVVGGGEVAETFAARLAFGGCDVERRSPDRSGPAGAGGAVDAVVLADGGGLVGVDLAPLDLPAWTRWALARLRSGGTLVLVGADGRLRDDAAPGGPGALLEDAAALAGAAGVRLSGVLLGEVRTDRRTVGAPPSAAASAGALAAEAVEYLCSARSEALSGALLRAPVVAPGAARRTGGDERRAVRRGLGAGGPDGSH